MPAFPGSTQKSITRTPFVCVLLKRCPQGGRRSRHGSSRAGQPRRTSSSVNWARPKERFLDKVDEAAPQSLEEIVAEVSKSVGLKDRKEQ